MNHYSQPEELEISFWRRAVARRKVLVLAVVAVFVAVTVAVVLLRPATYSASSEVFVSGSDVTPEIQFVKSQHVVNTVERELGYPPQVTVEGSETAYILVIQATSATPEEAVRVADTYATAYVRLREAADDQARQSSEAGLRREIAETERALRTTPGGASSEAGRGLARDLAASQESLTAVSTASAQASTRPLVLSKATPDPADGSSGVLLYGAAAAALGLVAGIGLAGISVGLDKRIAEPGPATQILRAPLLGTVRSANDLMYGPPRGVRRRRRWLGRRDVLAGAGTPEAEAVGLIRSRLLPIDQKVRGTVLVCGVDSGDHVDASAVAADLAQSFARVGVSTALVWADFRFAGNELAELGGTPSGRGLAEVVAGACPLAGALQSSSTVPHLALLAPGEPPHTVIDFLSSSGFGRMLEELVTLVDVVVVHTPPTDHNAGSSIVARAVDASVVVVGAQTRRDRLAQAEEEMRATGVHVEGIVFAGSVRP